MLGYWFLSGKMKDRWRLFRGRVDIGGKFGNGRAKIGTSKG